MHLSDYMIKNGLSDEDVAAILDRSRVTVSRIRRRKVRPDWETIERMKVAFEGAVTADDFTDKPANDDPATPSQERAAS